MRNGDQKEGMRRGLKSNHLYSCQSKLDHFDEKHATEGPISSCKSTPTEEKISDALNGPLSPPLIDATEPC